MPFESLREFMERLDQLGELKKIDGGDWNLEMGVLNELMWDAGGLALLFQNITSTVKSAQSHGTGRHTLAP